MNSKLDSPLVSVTVITYNSSRFVIETLESIKAQTYKNIELIVSDDCSKDNTVALVEEWINLNKERFVDARLVTSIINTGISANKNRAIAAMKGEWLKSIAGDDILMPNCIKDNIENVKNKDIKVLFSAVQLFKIENNGKKLLNKFPKEDQKKLFELDAQEQYTRLLLNNFVWTAPSLFIQRNLLNTLGNYSEGYGMIEDYPFWLKITRNGIKLNYFEKVTVLYRQSDSITRNVDKWMHESYFDSYSKFFKDQISPELKKIDKKRFINKSIYFFKYRILVKSFKNKKSFMAKVFNRLMDYFISSKDL